MRADIRDRYEPGLRQAVERVATYDGDDEHLVWRLTADALAWLYRCEQVEKSDPDYFRDRDARAQGRALGGLIWFRNALEHEGRSEVRALSWLPSTVHVYEEGAWREATMHVFQNGEWHPVETMVCKWVWSQAADMKPDSQGRHNMYQEAVEGKPVADPLLAAEAYLVGRGLGS